MLNLLGHIPVWRSRPPVFNFLFFIFFYCSFDTQDLISEFSVYAKVVQRGSCCLVSVVTIRNRYLYHGGDSKWRSIFS